MSEVKTGLVLEGGDKQRLGEARGHIPDGNETGQ